VQNQQQSATVLAGQGDQFINAPTCPAGTQLVDFGGYPPAGTDVTMLGTNGFGSGGQVLFRNTGTTDVQVTMWSNCTSTTP
jgi:hypothetical protein